MNNFKSYMLGIGLSVLLAAPGMAATKVGLLLPKSGVFAALGMKSTTALSWR